MSLTWRRNPLARDHVNSIKPHRSPVYPDHCRSSEMLALAICGLKTISTDLSSRTIICESSPGRPLVCPDKLARHQLREASFRRAGGSADSSVANVAMRGQSLPGVLYLSRRIGNAVPLLDPASISRTLAPPLPARGFRREAAADFSIASLWSLRIRRRSRKAIKAAQRLSFR